MAKCTCLPSHVPASNFGCGIYEISAVGVYSGQRKTFTINVACLSFWSSGGGQYAAFDWCDCNGGYSYFYALAGEDGKGGTGTVAKIGECPCPGTKYDCLNGQCADSDKYNTPGIYTTLSDCQAVCANGGSCGSGKQCVDPTTFCPDGKVCIEQLEYSSIQGLISKIGSEVC